MINLVTILFVSGFFMAGPPADTVLTDLEIYRLKGNVRSVTETRYALAEGADSNATTRVMYQKYMAFDQDGYLVESALYQDGKEFLVSKYSFGPNGKQAEMNEYNGDGSLNAHVLYTYDKKGNRTRADYQWAEQREIGEFIGNTDYYYEILNNDIYTKVIYKNEYRGYCTEEHYLRADSTLSFKFISKYDFRGNKLETGYYHESGRLSWMTKNKYDKYDNLVESRVYKSNYIAVLTHYAYQFDDVGNWTVRSEDREVHVNILTAGLEQGNMVTQRKIEYY